MPNRVSQTFAEFLLEKGFIDLVVDRNNLKDKLDNILSILK